MPEPQAKETLRNLRNELKETSSGPTRRRSKACSQHVHLPDTSSLQKRTWSRGHTKKEPTLGSHCKESRWHTGCTRSNVASRLNEAFILFCSPMVRLHLRYCVYLQVFQFTRDVDKLEKVPKRATRMVIVPEHMSWIETVRFFCPAKERLRIDLVEACNCLLY